MEHYTPLDIVAASRRLMGEIDLDPASCARANKYVQAAKFYTKRDDGLSPRRPWAGRLFINPPGGVTDPATGARLAPSLVRPFWERLATHYLDGSVEQAIFVGFSLEQLQSLQLASECGISPLDVPLCFPRRRIRFLLPSGQPNPRPTHANYIAFLPPRFEPKTAIRYFAELFSAFGAVRTDLASGIEWKTPSTDPRQGEFRGLA
jgi:ParB family chromosome partitioning protein